MTIKPVRVEDSKADTLHSLESFQESVRNNAPVAELQSHAINLRQQLVDLCSTFLSSDESMESQPTTLVARDAVTQAIPQPASPSHETPSAERIEQLQEGIEETHLTPLEELQRRNALRAASEQCSRALDLMDNVENKLIAQDNSVLTLVDDLEQLKAIVEQLPKALLP